MSKRTPRAKESIAAPAEIAVNRPCHPRLLFDAASKTIPTNRSGWRSSTFVNPTATQNLEHAEVGEFASMLSDRYAMRLGWARERIVVIDEDQGQSGRHAEHRQGFQRLLAEVTLDHVGLILALEMSRLARLRHGLAPSLGAVCRPSALCSPTRMASTTPQNPNDRLCSA